MRMVNVFDSSLLQKMHIVRKDVSDDCTALRSLCADYGVQPTYRIIDYDADTRLFVFDGYLVIARMSLDIDYVQYVVVYASEDACHRYAQNIIAKNNDCSFFEFNQRFDVDSIWVDKEERDVRNAHICFDKESLKDKHVYIDIKQCNIWLEYTYANGKPGKKDICVTPAYRGREFKSYRNIHIQRAIYRDGSPIGVICLNPAYMLLSCIYGVNYSVILDLVHAGMVSEHIISSDYNGAGAVQLVGCNVNLKLGSFANKTGIRGNLEEVLKAE